MHSPDPAKGLQGASGEARMLVVWKAIGLPLGVVKDIQLYIYICIQIYTSSTAQGGGGSFKNRKPIGEVGCCESRMAERSH